MHRSIDDVNAMSRADFVAFVGPAFERAPWIAEAAWSARPFADAEALHDAMFAVVERASRATRTTFLCGHPDLAGREARAAAMTRESVDEQSSAGLDALSVDELEAVATFNDAYRARHGFPFIVAVRRHSKDEILRAMRSRLANDTADEFDEAMRQIRFITRGRIDALLAQPALEKMP